MFLVARGGIEPPTQGFSIIVSHLFWPYEKIILLCNLLILMS
jgi:hypothetical protein